MTTSNISHSRKQISTNSLVAFLSYNKYHGFLVCIINCTNTFTFIKNKETDRSLFQKYFNFWPFKQININEYYMWSKCMEAFFHWHDSFFLNTSPNPFRLNLNNVIFHQIKLKWDSHKIYTKDKFSNLSNVKDEMQIINHLCR